MDWGGNKKTERKKPRIGKKNRNRGKKNPESKDPFSLAHDSGVLGGY